MRSPCGFLKDSTGKPILLLRRFDREQETRLPFLSAMIMLGAKDNETRKLGLQPEDL